VEKRKEGKGKRKKKGKIPRQGGKEGRRGGKKGERNQRGQKYIIPSLFCLSPAERERGRGKGKGGEIRDRCRDGQARRS